MDTSSKYIKMCKQAVELQPFYNPDLEFEFGDYVYDTQRKKVFILSNLIFDSSFQFENRRIIRVSEIPQFSFSVDNENAPSKILIRTADLPIYEIYQPIKLYRQDQLHFMPIKQRCSLYEKVVRYYSPDTIHHTTTEQLYLIVAMFFLYKKLWVGDDWIIIKGEIK